MKNAKSVILIIFGLIVGMVPQAFADTPISQSAMQYVANFWSAWSGPSSTALTYVEFAVTDPINFYGKPISRADYMKIQRTFVKRWPMRQYSVVPGSEQITCDQAKLTCDIGGTLNWRNFDPRRKVASIGTGTFAMSLRGLSDQNGDLTNFLIQSMSGFVTGRSLQYAPPDSALVRAASATGNFVASPTDQDDADSNIFVSGEALQNAGCASNDDEVLQHQDCISLAELDLTRTFHTSERMVFEITQDASGDSAESPSPLTFCFFQRRKALCQYDSSQSWGWPDQFTDLSVVYPEAGVPAPVLLAHVSWCCGFGCGGLFNYIWAYDPATDTFNLIWNRPYDCHTALRFVTKGVLAGDMIAVDNDVTDRWPWPYGIEVYRFVPPDQLVKLLNFVGRAGQGGKYVSGPDDAIDIDMPEILRRLSVSK